MQKYGVVYPNGFCGQWLVWMMQSHPGYSSGALLQKQKIKNFINGNNRTRHYTDAALWTPNLDYNMFNEINDLFPPINPPLQFNDFYNLYQHKTDKVIFRMGPNHSPACASLIMDYIDEDIDYIMITCRDPGHRKILASRIREYVNSSWHKGVVTPAMATRLKQIQIFSNKAMQDKLNYLLIDIGKLVFDANIEEYKKLCDYTNTEHRTDIFEEYQQEYYNEVWKYIIE